MHTARDFLAGLGLGAGLAYFLDPQWGRRRRAVAADRLAHLAHEAADATEVAARDAAHRARGLWATAASAVTGPTPDDRTLAERVRSHLGRVVSHPRAVHVAADGGRVTLSGPILAHEVSDLVAGVSRVPGVTAVENRLEVHKTRGDHPSLQGGGVPPGEPADWMQENWSPALRAVSVAAGAGLMANCLARRTPLAVLGGTAGFALFLRGLTNTDFGRLVGVTGGRRAVDVLKTFTIAGPVERVYPFFARYDTFPRFMRNIREVRDLGGGRSHWVARGPAGLPVSWDAVETARQPNRVLAWKSEPGSLVANAGVIRFEPAGEDTRVTIRFSYNPPGGALGHFAALLFGADPKGLMDEDLVRLKGLIETGQAAAPGKGEVTRQDVTEGAAVPAA